MTRFLKLGGVAGAAGGVALALFLKSPANPPSVGDPATITRRTVLYLAMLAWSLIATVAAWRLLEWGRARQWSVPVTASATAGVWAVIVAAGFIGLPPNPDKVEAPATLIWRFRLASAGGSAVLWAVTGMVLGALLSRSVGNSAAKRRAITHRT